MHITLSHALDAIDASPDSVGKPGWKKTVIDAGEYEIEMVPNPHGLYGDWLVLKGTMIGKGQRAWEFVTNEMQNKEGQAA